jgi:hypothetical protein
VPIGTSLDLGHSFDTCFVEFFVSTDDVVDPEACNGPGVELVMLSGVGPEYLEEITVGCRQTTETRNVDRQFHPEPLGEERSGSLPVLGSRPYPDDPFHMHHCTSRFQSIASREDPRGGAHAGDGRTD